MIALQPVTLLADMEKSQDINEIQNLREECQKRQLVSLVLGSKPRDSVASRLASLFHLFFETLVLWVWICTKIHVSSNTQMERKIFKPNLQTMFQSNL